MNLTIYDIFTAPPAYAFYYLVTFPASRVTHYVLLPLRLVYWALSSLFEAVFDLAGSYAALLKLLTMAALVGAVTGWTLHGMSSGLSKALGISSGQSLDNPPARTLADYRRQRREKRAQILREAEAEGELELRSAPWVDELSSE